MSYFLSAIQSVKFDLGGDDDTADKMSSRYSIILLVVFTVVVSTKQYVGDPIDCWVPGIFTGAMRDYTDNMCWIKNTYYIPLDETIPNKDELITTEINYYQWVPFILIVQALFFYLPNMVWKSLNGRAGCDLKNIVKTLTDPNNINLETREKNIRFVSQHLDKFLSTRSRSRQNFLDRFASKICIGKKYGNYMMASYFLIKVLYFANALTQLFMLNLFFGENYTVYGFEVLGNLFRGIDTGESRRFPRSTLCSFKVREFGGNTHRHTVQCVLSINLFNEKIYIFIWFWLMFVTIITFLSLLIWIWDFIGKTRIQFLKHHMKMVKDFEYDRKADRNCIKEFTNEYLRGDGVFILKLIGKNVNDVLLCEIIIALYEIFRARHYIPKRGSMENLNKEDNSFSTV